MGAERKSRVKPSPLPHHHPHRPCSMSFRQSFSKLRKKAKDKLSKIGDGIERTLASVDDKRSGRSTLSLQSESGIAVDEGEVGDVSVGKDDLQPDDSRPVSRSAVRTGQEQGGSDDKASGETSQKHIHLFPQTESGSSRKRGDVDRKRADRADPPPQSSIGDETTPTSSILGGDESEST